MKCLLFPKMASKTFLALGIVVALLCTFSTAQADQTLGEKSITTDSDDILPEDAFNKLLDFIEELVIFLPSELHQQLLQSIKTAKDEVLIVVQSLLIVAEEYDADIREEYDDIISSGWLEIRKKSFAFFKALTRIATELVKILQKEGESFESAASRSIVIGKAMTNAGVPHETWMTLLETCVYEVSTIVGLTLNKLETVGRTKADSEFAAEVTQIINEGMSALGTEKLSLDKAILAFEKQVDDSGFSTELLLMQFSLTKQDLLGSHSRGVSVLQKAFKNTHVEQEAKEIIEQLDSKVNELAGSDDSHLMELPTQDLVKFIRTVCLSISMAEAIAAQHLLKIVPEGRMDLVDAIEDVQEQWIEDFKVMHAPLKEMLDRHNQQRGS